MKKIILSALIVSLFASCDKSSMMDANIKNNTSQNLSLTFFRTSEPNDSLQLESNQTMLFQDDFSSTGGFLTPNLIQFDSIYIQNQSDEILKVFKENTEGKNIYNVDEFWILNQPSEDIYNYEYTINNEDIE